MSSEKFEGFLQPKLVPETRAAVCRVREPRTGRPAAECQTCYACLRQGHIRRDCPYWVGGRVSHPERRRQQIPQAVCRVREPRQPPVCWTCGQADHLWRDCPGPRNAGQGNPGGSRPTKKRPKAARRQGVCWGCQKPGHIRRHCPLKGLEGGPTEVAVPGGQPGS
uniref:CCHC-type domain-containing protein n=1 Tax=Chelonoidis abingdonii TaxID=106734 RepID=A0A8C0HAH5_CHEAB